LKKIFSSAAVTGVLLASAVSAHAQELSASANVALTNDYVFRGVSQTNEDPALQGGFDLSIGPGFYAGIWGSNVDFSPGEGSLEVDYYGGWSKEWDNGLGLDVGLIYYDYFPSSVAEFTEIYAQLSWNFIGVNIWWDVNSDQEDYKVYEGTLAYEFPNTGIGVDGLIGKVDPDSGTGDYGYWNVGGTYSFGEGWGLDLRYHDTDSDGEKLFANNATDRVVFSISKEM
jgi:uncharacterized protein (TIGR02001 family)